jgi:hypothetical protein
MAQQRLPPLYKPDEGSAPRAVYSQSVDPTSTPQRGLATYIPRVPHFLPGESAGWGISTNRQLNFLIELGPSNADSINFRH